MALFWAALLALLLLPGALMARCVPLLWDRLDPGERILPAFLLSAAWLGTVWSIALPVFPTVPAAAAVWGGGVLVLAGVSELTRRRRIPRGSARSAAPRRAQPDRGEATVTSPGRGDVTMPPSPTLAPPADRAATATVFVLLLAAFLAVVREGGSVGYIQDSLDFIAFVRRMLETGRIDVVSAAYRDVGNMGPDPRRGAFHLGMALVCWLTKTSPVDMWRWLPAVLTPLSLWVFFATFRRILSPRAAAAALFFLLAALLFSPERFLHNLAYASRLGWVYSWVALWAVALFLDAERTDRTPPGDWSAPRYPTEAPGRPGRSAALLAIAAPAVLLAVHVLSALQCAAALAAFTWTWALARREPRPLRRWLFLLPLASLAVLLPPLALKLLQSYSTANPIFDHPQGLLHLGGGLVLLAPDSFLRWFGWHGLLAMLLVLPLVPRFRENRAHAYLVGSSLISALVLWNPLATWAIEAAGAHSLLFRMLFVAPIYPALGYTFDWALRRLRDRISPWRFALALAYVVAVAGVLLLEVGQTVAFFRKPPSQRAPWAESAPLRAALEELSRIAPTPSVVVSDPITSYQIPAYSSHYAIAPFHQHSSPADAGAVTRIHDATAILNPYVPLTRTVELLRVYGAEYVLLNHAVPRYVRFFLASITPETFAAERAKFEGSPAVFAKVYDREGVVVFRFEDPGAEFAAAPVVNPFLALDAGAAAGSSAEEVARHLGAVPVAIAPMGGIQPIGVVFAAPSVETGGFVRILTYWRRTGPAGPLPVEAFYRLETAWPDARFASPVFGKPYRYVYERRAGRTYRFGRSRGPLEDRFPPFLWEEGAVYLDDYEVPVPPHAAPGLYTVSLRLGEIPFALNFQFRDYFDLRDSFDGRPIGEVRITAASTDE